MSGRSRGRGRGDFFSANPEERRPLRRPGDGAPAAGGDDRPQPRRPGDGFSCSESAHPPPQQQRVSDIAPEVQKLSLSAEPTEEEISAVLLGVPNDSQLLTVLRDLHEQALSSHTVATRLAAACGTLQAEAPEGSHLRNLRTHLLNFVQNNYKRRHDDRVSDPARFAGAGWLLCEVFRSVRLADGSVLRVLSAPILEYLSALLHCRPEDQVAAAAQLCRVGGSLNSCNGEAVSELLNSIRERLTSPDCSHALRADLLICVELAASGWTRLSPHARHFYSHHGVSVPDTSAAPKAAAAVGTSQRQVQNTVWKGEDAGSGAGVAGLRTAGPGAHVNAGAGQWVGKSLPEDDWDD